MLLIFRNSTDLELNHFGRRTAAYTWALLVMGTVILAINYPLGSPILFGPMLNALVYLWSRANPHSSVSFFGMVNCPSRWLPYVYIGIDLLQGRTGAGDPERTGLIAGYVYWMLDQVLPGQQRRRRGSLHSHTWFPRKLAAGFARSIARGAKHGQPKRSQSGRRHRVERGS